MITVEIFKIPTNNNMCLGHVHGKQTMLEMWLTGVFLTWDQKMCFGLIYFGKVNKKMLIRREIPI